MFLKSILCRFGSRSITFTLLRLSPLNHAYESYSLRSSRMQHISSRDVDSVFRLNSISPCCTSCLSAGQQKNHYSSFKLEVHHSRDALFRFGSRRLDGQWHLVRFAGHSHWKNIKHTKETNDALKQKVAIDIVRKIKVAVQEGGGNTNPKLNSHLARALDEGKSKDVSGVTMMEALKRMEKMKDKKGVQLFVEGKGIAGSFIIVENLTEKPKWARQHVQSVLKKYGGGIGDAGTSMHSFNHRGVVYVAMSSTSEQGQPLPVLTYDRAFELAIEAGAEEVVEGFDDDDQEAFQFICEPKQVHALKKALMGFSLKPHEARLEYIPHTFLTLDSAHLELASKMLDDLKAIEDVIQVFHNINFS